MLITVATAMYHEEDSVPLLIENYAKLLAIAPKDWNFSFLFVDDGSKDRTVEVLSRCLPMDWNARVIQHEKNKGFGGALRTAIDHATGDVFVCYDADSTYQVEDIVRLVHELGNGWDVVSANPFLTDKRLERVPLWRQFMTLANAGLYKLSLGRGGRQVKIFSCAFRAYRMEIIKPMIFKSNGFGAASEVLGRLIIDKRKVLEVYSALSTRQFGESKMNVRKAIREHLRNVMLFAKIKYLNY